MPKIPGISTLLKKLNLKVNNFIFPCLYPNYIKSFLKGDKVKFSPDTNEFDTIITEPLCKVETKTFSFVDPIEANYFFPNFLDMLYSNQNFSKKDLNFFGFGCRVEHLPKVKEKVSEKFEKLEIGSYILNFSYSGSLEKVKKVHSFLEHDGQINVFVEKRSDVKDIFEKNSTVICHHTFHTYLEYLSNEEMVLKASKEIGHTQLINLHHMERRLKRLKKYIEIVGFESVYYAEVENRLLYFPLKVKEIELKEIENLKVGNYRWVILQST